MNQSEQNNGPPEPEPESQNWQEPGMGSFFTDEELGEMYRESSSLEPDVPWTPKTRSISSQERENLRHGTWQEK